MRDRALVALLAAIATVTTGLLVAACGTKSAVAASLAADAASTASKTSRVAVSMTMHSRGMSITFSGTGIFDYAHSRGELQMGSGGGMQVREVFLPPRLYIRMPGGPGVPGEHGKSWISTSYPASAKLPAFSPLPGPQSDPMDLLSALSRVASSVKNLGGATIRGVAVTHYRVSIDLAKALSQAFGQQAHSSTRPRSSAYGSSLSVKMPMVPADVWVDGQGLVRRISVAMTPPHGTGAPASTRFTQTVSYYDFGVPVNVSAPPASQVVSVPGKGYFSGAAAGNGGGGYTKPPAVSGTLTPSQAAAAEQAVRAFWAGLAANNAKAAEQALVPSQRTCMTPAMKHLKFVVSGLRVVSAQPAGTGRATVRFTIRARVRVGGHSIPVLPGGAGRVNWLAARQIGGRWYVDAAHSSGGLVAALPCP